MAVRQQGPFRRLDIGALTAVEGRLSMLEVRRSALHAEELRAVLVLHRTCSRGGMGLSVQAHLALTLGCSDHRAGELLGSALLLRELPGAIEALECGLLTVEQSKAVVDLLYPVPENVALGVWQRIQAQLIADAEHGWVRTPARFRRLISTWVIAADPDGATERRKTRQDDAEVDYRRGDDGLVELFARGLTGPDAHACLSRIRACAEPVGSADDRPAGRRRLDALVDLILGRDPVPASRDDEDPFRSEQAAVRCAGRPGGAPGCGCLPGSPVPCGAALSILVPLGAALGTTGELAELVGHGPLEPDLLRALLLAAPTLRTVWVDEAGVPVSASDTTVTLGRNDPGSVRDLLLRMASAPPGPAQPRHPDDHRPQGRAAPPGDGIDPNSPAPDDGLPTDEAGPRGRPDLVHVLGPPENAIPSGDPTRPTGQQRPLPRLLTNAHPASTPGPYRVPTGLRRLLTVRRPLCEWPGCGCPATGCDMEHDVAWPEGPTCSCQLGPLCRRHHRIKQLGWTKHRTADNVHWTSPTGRTWPSPTPHRAPEAWTRPVRALPAEPGPLDRLSPLQLEDELWHHDPTDPHWHDPRWIPDGAESLADDDPDTEPDDPSYLTLRHSSTRWNLDLDDPYVWLEPAWLVPSCLEPSRAEM